MSTEILWRRRAAFPSFNSVAIGKTEQFLVKRWNPSGTRFARLFSAVLCTSGGHVTIAPDLLKSDQLVLWLSPNCNLMRTSI